MTLEPEEWFDNFLTTPPHKFGASRHQQHPTGQKFTQAIGQALLNAVFRDAHTGNVIRHVLGKSV